MHKHSAVPDSTDFPTEAAWAEWVRDYYREVEEYDWVDVADHWRGLESIFHRNRRRVIRTLLNRFHAQEPMLDAGCGTGLNLASLPKGSVGIDINPRNVAMIRRRLPEHMTVEGDIEAMPFPDASFATVVCTEVLEHVPYPRTALAEIHRVLRPGGLLIGSVPARSHIWRLRFLSSTCPRSEPFHNEYVPTEVRRMLSGFDVKRIWLSAFHFNVMFVVSK